MAKKGMKQVDWRESSAKEIVPRVYKAGEKEKEIEILMKKIAPTQKEFRSKKAEEGERLSPVWKPDDIGTENFKNSAGTAYLRKID